MCDVDVCLSESEKEEDDVPLMQRVTRKRAVATKYFSDKSDDDSLESHGSDWEMSDD